MDSFPSPTHSDLPFFLLLSASMLTVQEIDLPKTNLIERRILMANHFIVLLFLLIFFDYLTLQRCADMDYTGMDKKLYVLHIFPWCRVVA